MNWNYQNCLQNFVVVVRALVMLNVLVGHLKSPLKTPWKNHNMVLDVLNIKVGEIAHTKRVSTGTTVLLLHTNLQMKKLAAKWVPRGLIINQKLERALISKQCL